MEEEVNMRVFPVIEDSDFEYSKLVENHFAFDIPQENQLVPPGMGEMVERSELLDLRHKVVELALKYGFRDIDTKLTKNKNDFDREFSILIYNEMNITASVAATIQSFLFINLKVIPDIIYWRWGDIKDRFTNIRRNFSGTQWWRYYLFAGNQEDEKFYKKLTESDISEIFERPNTRGFEDNAKNVLIWFKDLDKNNVDINSRDLFRATIKKFNSELAYRNYFSLGYDAREKLFTECYTEAQQEMR